MDHTEMEYQSQEDMNDLESDRFADFYNILNQFTGVNQGQDRLWWLGNFTSNHLTILSAEVTILTPKLSNGPGSIYRISRSHTKLFSLSSW